MFKFLVDTCVWLDLAKDPRQISVLGVVEELTKHGVVQLIVPRIVLNEFEANRARIAKDSEKSLAAHFKLVREAAGKVGGDKKKLNAFISQLDDVAHKIPLIGGHAVDALDRIEKLLSASTAIEASDAVKLRAAQRAIDKKAPFHRNKNSMCDAIVIEIYGECVLGKESRGTRFAFVTHNKSDFSVEDGNQKLPHPEFSGFFSRIKSLYFLNLAEALQRADPSLVTDIMIEQSWSSEPRELSEILEAEDVLFNQVWYNRHKIWEQKVKQGKIKIIENPASYSADLIKKEIWEGALKSAARVEKKYGKGNLGPWDDFEWGMINGKLSALRWVMGDEWDMLDT
jgi:hypothetical protein